MVKWGVLAAYLIQVELLLKNQSMTSWLKEYAEETHRLPSTLWRLLGAGRYYRELQRKFEDHGISLPDLTDPALAASPESLELLRKISRVAPKELPAVELLVMKGEISRRDLREIWLTYRPVLQGRTSRGTPRLVPRYDRHNKKMYTARAKAEALSLLRKVGSGWLGEQRSYIYKVLPTKDVPEFKGIEELLPDAFVLHGTSILGPLIIHTILVPTDQNQILELGEFLPPMPMDGLWLAIPRALLPFVHSVDIKGIGILVLTEDNIEVIRRPTSQEGGTVAREEILKRLLLTLMRPD